MARDPDRAAAGIAAQQRGLITWWQARYRARLTQRQIEWRLATKRWRQKQPQVYALAGTPPSWPQSALAAQLRARTERLAAGKRGPRLQELDDAALCGGSALWLRGCPRLGRPEHHELLVAHRRHPRVTGATVRRTRSLPATDIEIIDGVPTLTVPRLAVELCGRIDDLDFVAVLEELLGGGSRGLRDEVHDRAVALRNGRADLDRLIELTAPDAAGKFRSWLERHTCGLFSEAALPPAQWNLELHDDAGDLIGIGDAVWPQQRVVVELDGLRFHSATQQRRRDLRKDRRLSSLGWLVLRYTWLDVMERPDEVVAEVRAALAAR